MEEIWRGIDVGGGKSSCLCRDVREHEREHGPAEERGSTCSGKQDPTEKLHGKSSRKGREAGKLFSVRRKCIRRARLAKPSS